MFNIKINEHVLDAQEGSNILDNLRKLKIEIPTLCYHQDLSSFGSCRLCSVELKQNGKWKIVTSCDTLIEEGMEIRTNSENIFKNRKLVVSLLISKYPDDKVIQKLASKFDIKTKNSFPLSKRCILCGLCVRTCNEIVGTNALKISNKNNISNMNDNNISSLETTISFNPENCIGCGSCAYICPTSAVQMESKEKDDSKRSIWNKVFQMASCTTCGKYFAPIEQIEYISKKTNVSISKLMVCVSCR